MALFRQALWLVASFQALAEHKMKLKLSSCVLLCILVIGSSVWAKRGGAPVVAPVIYENTKYTVPNDDGIREYIEAWDIKTKKKIWELTIFTNPIQPGLEKDVQWVFIEKLQIEKGNLVVSDERARQFLVDLKTRQIKRLK